MSKSLFQKPDIPRVVDQIIDQSLTLTKDISNSLVYSSQTNSQVSSKILVETLIGESQLLLDLIQEKKTDTKNSFTGTISGEIVDKFSNLSFDPYHPEKYNPISYSTLQDLIAKAASEGDYRVIALADLTVSESNIRIIKYSLENQWLRYTQKNPNSLEVVTKHYLASFQSYYFSLKDFISSFSEKRGISLKDEIRIFSNLVRQQSLVEQGSKDTDVYASISSVLGLWRNTTKHITDQYLAVAVLPYYDMNKRLSDLIGRNNYAIYLDKNLRSAMTTLSILSDDALRNSGLQALSMQMEASLLSVLSEVEGSLLERYSEIQQLNEIRRYNLPLILNKNSTKDILDEISRYVQI